MKKILLLIFSLSGAFAEEQKPNVIFILADDLGFGDIACYGCPDARTPNIDKLADQGAKYTNFYANGTECNGGGNLEQGNLMKQFCTAV